MKLIKYLIGTASVSSVGAICDLSNDQKFRNFGKNLDSIDQIITDYFQIDDMTNRKCF